MLARCEAGCDWLEQSLTRNVLITSLGQTRDQSQQRPSFQLWQIPPFNFCPRSIETQTVKHEWNKQLSMGASRPETFILNLRAQVTAIVDSVENIASTWEYRLAVGWTIMTRDNNNTNINICPHYVSSRELQPVNRAESKHRAIISIISSEQLSPGLVTGHWTTWARTTCWRGQEPGPLPPDQSWRQLFTLAIIDTRDFGQEKRFCEKWQNQNGHCAASATITVKL